MKIGYARTSTVDQAAGFEAQRRDLLAAGCKKVFAEQVSSVAEREQLQAAIDYLRDGDVLVATKLDRVARSMRHLIQIVDQVEAKGAGLHILGMNLDTTSATGTLMLQVLGAVAEHERTMMLERQREGIAKAKAEGKYKGRARRRPWRRPVRLRRMLSAGTSPTEVAKRLKIGRSSVYRANTAAQHKATSRRRIDLRSQPHECYPVFLSIVTIARPFATPSRTTPAMSTATNVARPRSPVAANRLSRTTA